jgi:hypothetical protein
LVTSPDRTTEVPSVEPVREKWFVAPVVAWPMPEPSREVGSPSALAERITMTGQLQGGGKNPVTCPVRCTVVGGAADAAKAGKSITVKVNASTTGPRNTAL